MSEDTELEELKKMETWIFLEMGVTLGKVWKKKKPDVYMYIYVQVFKYIGAQ